jgi:hypothetical protein
VLCISLYKFKKLFGYKPEEEETKKSAENPERKKKTAKG